MKRVGVMAVHYGKEYLAHAVKSLAMVCEEVHIFYTPTPSFGFSEGAVCPDTQEELITEAFRLRNGLAPVFWHKLEGVTNENVHRTIMLDKATERGATLVAIADADEVWDPNALDQALLSAARSDQMAGRWLARFHNFWRSWQWTVRDSFRPVRIVDLRYPLHVDAYLDELSQPHPIYHFGYAQSIETMRYKFTCHGHKAEFKPNWFEQKFLAWTPYGDHYDLHPCVNDLWIAERTDAFTLLALDGLLGGHPHQFLKVIE
jgi:hypothetical protein